MKYRGFKIFMLSIAIVAFWLLAYAGLKYCFWLSFIIIVLSTIGLQPQKQKATSAIYSGIMIAWMLCIGVSVNEVLVNRIEKAEQRKLSVIAFDQKLLKESIIFIAK